MSEDDFKRFRKDLPKFKNAKGKEAERLEREWGDIVLPRKLLLASLVAMKFHAPWGTAFIRLAEEGWQSSKRKSAS